MGKVTTSRCSSWEAAKLELFQLHQLSGRTLFRGQKDARWGLPSSFLRLARQEQWDQKQRIQRERDLLEGFLEEAIRLGLVSHEEFSRDEPGVENKLRRFAQHHGLPTTLLDWTRSFYVAAFFAFDGLQREPLGNDIEEIAVWCLDLDALDRGSVARGKSLLAARSDNVSDDAARRRFREEVTAALLVEDAQRGGNARMRVQGGAFTHCIYELHDVHVNGLEQYVEQHEEFDDMTLRKVCIPAAEQERALEDLRIMGLDPGHVMVDLDFVAVTVLRKVRSLARPIVTVR